MARRDAFSLVELVVTLALVSVMMAMLLPALGQSRSQARSSVCMNTLRQLAIGMLVYEVDQRRLPLHASEIESGPGLRPWCLKAGAYDGRTVYRSYVDVNRMRCPWLPPLDFDRSAAATMFANYNLLPGYVDEATDPTWATGRTRWVRSDRPWSLQISATRYRLNVVAADRMYRDAGGYEVVNHASPSSSTGFELVQMDGPAACGTAWRRTAPTDCRADFTFNAANRDASVRTHRGDGADVIDLCDRFPGGRTLLPTAMP